MKTVLVSTVLSFIALLALSSTLFINAQLANADTVDITNTSLPTRSATGFYGRDDQDDLIPDRSGIMLVFDYPIVHDSVSFDDFWVQTDDGSYADVIEIQVCDNLVFLKIADELAPTATPAVGMNENEHLELDLGNSIERLYFDRVEISDGIPPTLAMTLSGGSGTGTGDEGPDRLTKDKIDITVTSDEPLEEPPNVTVVCNDIQWTESVDSTLIRNNIDDFIANRTGQLTETQSSNPDSLNNQPPDYWCDEDQEIIPTTRSMTATSATTWTYEWRNHTDPSAKLNDGLLTAVTYARDQSEYQHHDVGATIQNYTAISENFTLDTILKSPLEPSGGFVSPANGSITLATRPSVTVRFTEPTSVTLQSFRIDGVSRLEEIQPSIGYSNGFFFWPPKLKLGTHVVEVSASDAGGNTVSFETRFESDLRPPFILRLQPGWNAISFPARPVDNEIESIFTDPSIRFVVKWHPFSGDDEYGPWLWSSRRQGKLKTHIPDDHPIFESKVDFLYGLWVYSEDAVSQPVRLYPNSGYCSDSAIPRGWVFRGVTDWDDDQIEDHFGEDSSYHGDTDTAHSYHLGTHELAYRWDAQNQRYVVLEPDDAVKIGEAIWVYYSERDRSRSSAICP